MSAKRPKYDLIGELRCYRLIWRQHWPLVVSLGLFFGWLYYLPLAGTLVWELTRGLDTAPAFLIVCALAGTIPGLFSAALISRNHPRRAVYGSLGAIPGALVTLLVLGIPSSLWWILFLLMGFCSGMVITAWKTAFCAAIPRSLRGRTLASGITLSGLLTVLVELATAPARIEAGILIISLMLLGVPLVLRYRRQCATGREADEDVSSTGDNGQGQRIASPVLFLVFIFIIVAIGAMTFLVINQIAPLQQGILTAAGWLPYYILLLAAGSILDIQGWRRAAFIGVLMAGAGFMSAGFLPAPARYAAIQILAFGGYAFLDSLTWITAADFAVKKSRTTGFALVIGIYMLATLVGVAIGEWVTHFDNDIEMITISLSGICAILSLALIFRIKEPRAVPVVEKPVLAGISAPALMERFGLTRREAEIAVLLLNEASTEEILKQTSIAYTTLKGHCRNIYQKAEVHNRLEFTLVVMKENQSETKLAGNSILET